MSIQFEKANEIEEGWGNKPCSHPNIVKEYYLSRQTGDFRCTQCGATFTEDEVELMKLNKNNIGNENN